MVKYLEHRQLAARGLTCGKIRRRVKETKLKNFLETHWLIRSLLLVIILGGLVGIMMLGDTVVGTQQLVVALLLFVAALFQLWIGDHDIFCNNRRLTLIFGTLLVQFLLVKVLMIASTNEGFGEKIIPLLIPYTFAPLTLSALLGKKEGFFALFFGGLWGAFLVDHFTSINIPFLIISLITGLITVMVTFQVRRRSRLIRAGIYVGITTLVLSILFGEITFFAFPFSGDTNWLLFLLQSAAAFASGLGTSIVVSGLLPILEYLFRVTTDISWLEMADLNHPLLRRLSIEASGTYQHSLALATLAESAAEAVGANPTICRVGAYFHDIGKLVKPEYFTENMRSGDNPHQDLTPTMSALIIAAHVKEGVDLALKNKLHGRIIDIIRQHHGTTAIDFFFQRARQQEEDIRIGGKIMNMRLEDIPAVSIDQFRYPGPKPSTKEAAIIGLADAAESSTRSLERPTPQRIEDLIHTLLKERLLDNQYDECPITIGELHKIADSLINTLLGMFHTRIAYKKEATAKARPINDTEPQG
jgi:putative nucleotidyltransferase with HDIG domain